MFFQKQHSILDGRIVFTMFTRPVYAVLIERDELDRTLPDLSKSGTTIANIWWAYKECLPFTSHIAFNLSESDDLKWHALEQWWNEFMSKDEKDHPAAFKAYTQFMDVSIFDEWFKAYKATREAIPRAPEVIQPGAEQRAAQDKRFLEKETPKSNASSRLPAPSSKSKKKPKPKPSASGQGAQST